MQSRRTETSLVFYIACATTLTLAGCAAWREGYTLHEYQGQLRSVKNGGAGAERLQMESDFDPTVRDFVQQNGPPDYIYVGDRRTLQLIYVESQRVVLFERPWWNHVSQATVTVGPDALEIVYHQANQEALHAQSNTAPAEAVPNVSPIGNGGLLNQHPTMRAIAENIVGGALGAATQGDPETIDRYWAGVEKEHQRSEQAQEVSTVQAHASAVRSAVDVYDSNLKSFVDDYNRFQNEGERFAEAQQAFRFNLSDRQVALYEAAVSHQNRESLDRFLRALTAKQRTDLHALATTWQGLSERGATLADRARALQAQATALEMAQNQQALEAIDLHARWAAQEEQEEMTHAMQETARAVRQATHAAQQQADAERVRSDMQQFQLIQELRRLSSRPFRVPGPPN